MCARVDAPSIDGFAAEDCFSVIFKKMGISIKCGNRRGGTRDRVYPFGIEFLRHIILRFCFVFFILPFVNVSFGFAHVKYADYFFYEI